MARSVDVTEESDVRHQTEMVRGELRGRKSGLVQLVSARNIQGVDGEQLAGAVEDVVQDVFLLPLLLSDLPGRPVQSPHSLPLTALLLPQSVGGDEREAGAAREDGVELFTGQTIQVSSEDDGPASPQ